MSVVGDKETSLGQHSGTKTYPGWLPPGWLIAAASFILLGSFIVAYWATHASPSQPPARLSRTVIKVETGYELDGWRLPPPFGLNQPLLTAFAISSDARFLVYSAVRGGSGPGDKPQLFLRRTDQLEAKAIPGTEGGMSPFLSPDDRWVGFWADGNLRKVSVDGGVPHNLTDYQDIGTASWGTDNSIIFSSVTSSSLTKVTQVGGTPEVLTIPDKSHGEASHKLPHWLPDGKGVLFTIFRGQHDQEPRVALLDVKTHKWRVLLNDAADARYVSTGHLIFLRQGTLMAVPFDLRRGEITLPAVEVVPNVIQGLTQGAITAAGQFAISNTGTLVYATGTLSPEHEGDELVWADHKGVMQPVVPFKAAFWAPRLSPDGQRIAYITMGRDWRGWIYDLQRGTATQLTNEGFTDYPIWSPDGKRVAFKWWTSGEPNIFWQRTDGSSARERLTTSEFHQVPCSFSPDGSILAFVELRPDKGLKINLLDLNSRRITPLLNSRDDETFPEFSPDGHWLAYVSNESDRNEVYVRPFPKLDVKTQVSSAGGTEPAWSRDGKQLFFRSVCELWVVDVRTTTTFSASKPRLLFKQPDCRTSEPTRGWDVSPDGQHFLMTKLSSLKAQPLTELILVQDWFEELKRLVPTPKK